MSTERTSSIRPALFSLLITIALLALVEVLCRWLVPAPWLYGEAGNPILSKTVAFSKIDREHHLRTLRRNNSKEPDLQIDTGNYQQVLKPTTEQIGKNRWFLMGGSAARGWELPQADCLPALLEKRIDDLQVINAAMAAHTTEQVLSRSLKVLDHHRPDGLIIYSGNNELIGWNYPVTPRLLGVDLSPIIPWLDRSMAYKSLARVFRSLRNRNLTKPVEGRYYAKRSLVDDGFCAKYPFVPEEKFDRQSWDELRNLYSTIAVEKLSVVIEQAKQKNVTVILCTVPINPTLSPCYFLPQSTSLDPQFRDQAKQLLLGGWKHQAANQTNEALLLFDLVRQGDPQNALAAYGAGFVHLRNNDPAAAGPLLQNAREQTVGYLGSLYSYNDKIRELAKEKGAILCDLDREFERVSLESGGPLHDGLFSDYCHPTAKGNILIAELLAESLKSH